MKKTKFILALLASSALTLPATAQFNGGGGGGAFPLTNVVGNVALYVNPSSSSTTPCGVSGGSTCQAGNDANACTSIAAPCKTLQHADALLTQTRIWGINVGKAQIFLGDGTYPETDDLVPLFGSPVFSAEKNAVVEIVGNATTPANVIISAPNNSCTRGAVLFFEPGANYWIHDFTVTAVNEVTLGCNLVQVQASAQVAASGTMDYGIPGGNNNVIQLNGAYSMSYETPAAIMNIAAGTAGYSWVQVSGGGVFYYDFSTVNFVGTNTFSRGLIVAASPGGWVSTSSTVTYTGSVTSTNCFYARELGHVEGSNLGEEYTSFAGCTVSAGQRNAIQNVVSDGTVVGSTVVASHFATNISQGAAPTVTSCGSGASQVDAQSTDQSGHIVEGSGATACTLVFYITYPLRPNCTVSAYGAAGLVTNFAINGSGSAWTGFTVSNSGGSPITFDYTCWHHY